MEERIGSVIRFFDKNSVAAVRLGSGDLSVGDTIRPAGPFDFASRFTG